MCHKYGLSLPSFISLLLFSVMFLAQSPLPVRAQESSDELVVAILANWPPQYVTAPKTGRPTGFAIDVFDEVARRAGITFRYETYSSWPKIHDAIKNGQADAVPNMGIIPERADLFDFTSPVEAFDIHIFVRGASTEIQEIEDLQGRNVGVVQSNKGLFLMQERGESELTIYNSLEEAFFGLLAARVDALVYPEPPVLQLAYQSRLENRIQAVGKPLLEIKRGIALRKGQSKLLLRLNKVVDEFTRTQAYKQIYEKWFRPPVPFWNVTRVLLLMSSVILGVILMMGLWHYQSLIRLNRELLQQIVFRQETEEQLRQAHEELEQRVAQRTTELSDVNMNLRQEVQERLRVENALRQAKERAEAASRSKTGFLANMSHEFRTPLNGILGYTQILQRNGGLSTQQQEQVEIIEHSGKHLLTLIDDLLDLAKIEAGRVETEPVEFNFHDFLQDLAEMIDIRARQKGLTLYSQIPAELPAAVYSDEVRLRQILLNLLGNAVKYTEQGSVTFRVIDLGFEETDRQSAPTRSKPRLSRLHNIRFEVKDTGTGIPADQIEATFQPFEQMHLDSFKAVGTGLGLTISQRLAQIMGSRISVESHVGQGSRFWCDLKLQECEALPEREVITSRKIIGVKGEAKKVLLVDDIKDNRSVLRALLKPLGFLITEAEDGHAALAKVQALKPDVILLDLRLPKMDGFEVTQRLRSMPEYNDVVIIAISASVYRQTRQRILDAGCDEFIGKPFEAESLLTTIARLLHIEWVYEEEQEEQPLTAESSSRQTDVIAPPGEKLQELLTLVRKRLILDIRQHLDRLERETPRYRSFTERMRQLSKSFEFNKMQSILQSLLEDAHER